MNLAVTDRDTLVSASTMEGEMAVDMFLRLDDFVAIHGESKAPGADGTLDDLAIDPNNPNVDPSDPSVGLFPTETIFPTEMIRPTGTPGPDDGGIVINWTPGPDDNVVELLGQPTETFDIAHEGFLR
jgi:hypothetical protein